jgi:O-succinylbenzoic acid--CoA ligase
VKSLLALDFPLGSQLENAIRTCVDEGSAFCVLDQRISTQRQRDDLDLLGATVVLDQNGRSEHREGQQVDDDIGLVMLTSGSSGVAKAAELTWDALRSSAVITQATLRSDSPPVWYPCLPANHIGGLAVLLRSILDDATLLWGSPDELALAPEKGATHISVVRTQLARHDLSHYQKVLLGGARPPMDLPSNVVTTWGMTETGSGVVYNGVALDTVEVASRDGEIIVRSPTLFRSYRTMQRPEVVGPDGVSNWFPTGDAGDVVNGRVMVRGRLGYVINTGGEKLWPEDLEAVLMMLPGIDDVAITGEDDLEWGQRVVALVVGNDPGLELRILATANEMIGAWAKPKRVIFVKSIPRTGNGKIRRGALGALL